MVTVLMRLLTSRLTPFRPISSLSSFFRSSMFSGGVSSSAACWASAGLASAAGAGPWCPAASAARALCRRLFGAGMGDLGVGTPHMSSAMLLRLLLTSVLIRSIWVRMISSRLSMIVLLSIRFKGITDAIDIGYSGLPFRNAPGLFGGSAFFFPGARGFFGASSALAAFLRVAGFFAGASAASALGLAVRLRVAGFTSPSSVFVAASSVLASARPSSSRASSPPPGSASHTARCTASRTGPSRTGPSWREWPGC